MLEITARDVIGTAHSNAAAATSKLKVLLDAVGDDLPPTEGQWLEIAHCLNSALSDLMLARHQMSFDWTDAVYIGRWDR